MSFKQDWESYTTASNTGLVSYATGGNYYLQDNTGDAGSWATVTTHPVLEERIAKLEARIEKLEGKKKPFSAIEFLTKVYNTHSKGDARGRHFIFEVGEKFYKKYESELQPMQRFVYNEDEQIGLPALLFKGSRVVINRDLRGKEYRVRLEQIGE